MSYNTSASAARAMAPLCRPASPTPASLAPTETAYDLFARLEWPGLPLLPFEAHDGGLKVGETLELLGEPSTGKTALLLESCARCILSAEHGGHGARAVIVETDGGFDVRRLAAALARKLEASAAAAAARGGSSSTLSSDGVSAAVEAALRRLRVIRCHSACELLRGLQALRCELDAPPPPGAATPATPATPAASSSSSSSADNDGRPRLLLIDSLSAFQWLDRAEQQRLSAAGEPSDYAVRLNALVGLLRRQRLSIVWSRSPLMSRWRIGHADSGTDFPIVDRSDSAASVALPELSQPTRRVRLRRLDEWKDEDKPFRFEVLVDALQAQAGPGTPAPPPMHYSLQYSMPGVCVM